jgi:ankyrin repeat protein
MLLEETSEKGNRPLVVAARNRQLGVVKLLIGRGADVNAIGASGSTALHGAAYGGEEQTVAFLLSQGSQANSRDAFGETPLLVACEEGRLAVVGLLLRHVGGQALHQTDDRGRTALHWAALQGHEDIVAFLLGQGAETQSRDLWDRTPLLCGCRRGHLGVVRVLARHMGEDGLKEKDANGRTVLHWAVEKGYHECSSLFKVKAIPNLGREPLRETIRTVPTKS